MERFKRFYNFTALMLLNTLLAVIFVNLLLSVFYFVKDSYAEIFSEPSNQHRLFNEDGSPVDNGKRSDYQLDLFDYNATNEVSETHASEVLDDFYELSQKGFIYQPWVQFSEPPFEGKHVSVGIDGRGFPVRTTVNPPVDPAKAVINIFVLGGSTTFGYNVSDEHTWPSYLAKILNEKAESGGLPVQINVTNYGRGFYDTSQEMILYIDLLKNGHRPGLVIFMDGVNWGPEADVPHFTETLEAGMANMQRPNPEFVMGHLRGVLVEWFSLARFARSVKSLLVPEEAAPNKQSASTDDSMPIKELTPDELEPVFQVQRRFEQNREIIKAVSGIYGIDTLFFIQPDPIANYPEDLHRNTAWPDFEVKRRQALDTQLRQSDDVIYLGDLFESYGVNQSNKVILDDVHYSPNFNQYLAGQVAAQIEIEKLIASSSPTQPAEATGLGR